MMLPMQSIFAGGIAFGEQIGVRVRRRRPQKIRDGIRDQPVDLLGHAPIAAA